MKLAKKILSVVLAVAIALGAFVVAASANGNPDTAEYQAKIWLTGTAGTVKWTSNSANTKTETGDESEPGGVVEAQPGEVVFVRIYVTNNYYVHSFQTNLFYSADLIDAAEDYQSQRNRTITGANLKKIHIWNTDHEWVAEHGTTNAQQNAWSLQSDSAKYLVSENWPTTDDGTEILKQADWKWNRIYNLATADVGFTTIWEDDSTHLLMMPVKVPADAKPGSEYTVMIPEGLEQRSAKKGGSLRLAEVGICDGESEVTGDIDTNAQNYPNMQYGDENQYFDLSEAKITIKVPGGSAAADTAALEAALADANDRLADDLTDASVAMLNAAIEAGEAALTSNDQDQIDAAVATLEEAIAASEVKADYTALNNAISRYDALNPADWSNFDSVADEYAAAKAIKAGLGVSQQGTIDAAAAALNAAIDALDVALNYADLAAKYDEVKDTDTAIYTDATVAEFNAALAAAEALINDKNAADQAEIDNALAALTAAFAALDEKAADYTALNKAIADFEALNAKAWTTASYNAAKAAYDAAKAVAGDLKISAQATVDAAAAELNAKLGALVPATGADYTALNKAIADAKALVADNYVSFADVTAALAAAENVAPDLTSEDQATIDAAAKALNDAIAALVPADADYSAVNSAKAAAQAILDKKDDGVNSYSDATLEAINAALAGVEEGLKKADQAKVDAMAAAINQAIANAEFRAWDYTAINEKIAAIEANPADYYDAAQYAAYVAAKEALVWTYTYENYANAKLQEIKFLRQNPAAAAAADYSAVEEAIAAFEAKIAAADYEQAGIDAVRAEIAKVAYGLNVNSQATVDAYAAAIVAATAKLVEIVVEYADYTALNNAIADAKTYDANLYTAGTYVDLADALAAAEALDKNLLKADQAIVDAAAQAIVNAIAGLEKKADYAALDAAILRAGTYDKNAWTADTWAAVEEALAAAEAVDRYLGETAQATVDAAAAALNKALDELQAKEVVSNISTITYTPAEDTHNTFDVVVNGRVAMVQFIEEDGGTRTYDRYSDKVTIKSFNADGEEVNELDRAVAYEIWTINTNLIGPNVEVRTKYISGTRYVWETERYSLTLEFVEPEFDADIRDIQPAATSGKKGAIVTTVVVGPDAQGIQFRMANGTTTTYYADKATVLDNGDLEFTGKAWANEAGLNTIIVMVRENGKWVEAGAFEYTVE